MSEEAFIETINYLDKLTSSVCFLYHDSFEGYVNDQRITLKRKLQYISYWLLSGYLFVYFLIAFKYPDRDLMRTMGSSMSVITDQYNLLNALFLFTASFKIFTMANMLYLERQRKLYVFQLIHKWTVSPDLFCLNHTNTRKLIMRIQLLYWFMTIYIVMVQFIIYSVFISYGVIAYFQYDYPLISLVVHLMAFICFIGNISNQLLVSLLGFFGPISYLNLRFDQINQLIKVHTLWNNKRGIMNAIKQHDNTVRLLNQLAILNNLIIGLIYVSYPYSIGLNIELLLIRDKWIIKSVVVLCLMAFMAGVYILNHICASISIRNVVIQKFLFRTLCNKKNLKLGIKLKLENFLVKLITEFIGFYAMNWFKFTMLAFYRFIFAISSAYILIKNIKNNMFN